jgi:hypothetical protein
LDQLKNSLAQIQSKISKLNTDLKRINSFKSIPIFGGILAAMSSLCSADVEERLEDAQNEKSKIES